MKLKVRGKIIIALVFSTIIFTALNLTAFIPGGNINRLLTFAGGVILMTGLTAIVYLFFNSAINKFKQSLEKVEKNILNTDASMSKNLDIEDMATSFDLLINQVQEKEGNLKNEEKKMESMLQALSEAVIAIDESFRILVFNKTAELFTGFTAQTVMGKHIDEIVQLYGGDEKIVLSNYIQKPDELASIHRERGLQIKSQSEKIFYVSIDVAPLVFGSGESHGYILTFYDETNQKALEEMKLDFVSMAAHELRTPLTVI